MHTDVLDYTHVYLATKGLPVNVSVEQHGSRSRDHALEVRLTGWGGRRRRTMNGAGHAAYWDEWGYFLGRLFHWDEDMLAGTYHGAVDYHWQTAGRFADPFLPLEALHIHPYHRWIGERCQGCPAVCRRGHIPTAGGHDG